jgi:hypothetical protein
MGFRLTTFVKCLTIILLALLFLLKFSIFHIDFVKFVQVKLESQ